MSCGIGQGCDPPLLWLWYRLVAVALICPLPWELPYATGAALKKKKKVKDSVHGLPLLTVLVFVLRLFSCTLVFVFKYIHSVLKHPFF